MHFFSHIVFLNRDEFTYKIIPDTIKKMDIIRINANPIIVRGDEDWEKDLWIAGTLLINLVVYFVGRKLKRRRLDGPLNF